MSDFVKCLGRGLLLLALSGSVFACGDDDESTDREDGGGGRSGSAGRDGRSGAGGAGRGDAGADDGGTPDVSEAQCRDMTETNASGAVPDPCAACLCEDSPRETAECDAECWNLISCFAQNCPGLASSTNAGSMCAVANCMELLGGAFYARPVQMVMQSACPDVCVIADTDAGADDGGT